VRNSANGRRQPDSRISAGEAEASAVETTNRTKASGAPAQRPLALFPDELVDRLRVRGKARRLTELCVSCDIVHNCSLGAKLNKIFHDVCKPEVGMEFRYCADCSRTLGSACAIDQAELKQALHEQLEHCNVRRNFEMPLTLLRLDLMFARKYGVRQEA
jgi:hypothetical protein